MKKKPIITFVVLFLMAFLQGCSALKPKVGTPVTARIVKESHCYSNNYGGNKVYQGRHCETFVLEDVEGNQKEVRLVTTKRLGEWVGLTCYLTDAGQYCRGSAIEWNQRRIDNTKVNGGRFITR